MKKYLILFLLLSMSSFAFAQDDAQNNSAAIKQLIEDTFDGVWSDLKVENIKKYHTEDFLLLEHGEVWNNDSIANYLEIANKRTPLPTRTNRIEIISTKIYNGRAWVAYQNYAIFTIDQKVVREAHWLESAAAVWTAEGWKLDMLHSTRVED